MTEYSRFAAMLGTEFHRYLIQHPAKAKDIPRNALIIFQVEGEDAFNKWSKEIGLKNREQDQPVVYISIKRFREESALNIVKITSMVA